MIASAKRHQPRGQASLEYLVVLAAFLSFLAVWAPLSEWVRASAIEKAGEAEASFELSRLEHAAEDAYLLGEGNSREVEVHALAGKTVRLQGKFTPAGAELVIPANSREVIVSCCTNEGKVEFKASTVPP